MSNTSKSGNDMADQLLFESGPNGGSAIHNLLLNGPGSAAIHQATVPLNWFLDRVRRYYAAQETQLFGLVPWGMTLRSIYQRHGRSVFLIEVPPGVRTLRWLRDDSPVPYGARATYQDVALALPYQYFFVAVTPQSELSRNQSVYFLDQPLQSLREPLGECHYYNCSVKAYGVSCWICTQPVDLSLTPPCGVTPLEQVGLFVEWFFASAFNASSEHHEGSSFWSKNKDHLGDKRVSTLEKWKKATAKNPNFILEVPWVSSLSALAVFEELTPVQSGRAERLSSLVRLMREGGQ